MGAIEKTSNDLSGSDREVTGMERHYSPSLSRQLKMMDGSVALMLR